jgi:hypothetical protein
MTGREFTEWIEDHDCLRDTNVQGFNVTGFAIVYRRRNTSYFAYFSGPFDDRPVPKRDIRDTCDALHIDVPPKL